jgi:hypothetical protein
MAKDVPRSNAVRRIDYAPEDGTVGNSTVADAEIEEKPRPLSGGIVWKLRNGFNSQCSRLQVAVSEAIFQT